MFNVRVTHSPGVCWRDVLRFRQAVERAAGQAFDGTGWDASLRADGQAAADALATKLRTAGFTVTVNAPAY